MSIYIDNIYHIETILKQQFNGHYAWLSAGFWWKMVITSSIFVDHHWSFFYVYGSPFKNTVITSSTFMDHHWRFFHIYGSPVENTVITQYFWITSEK